MDLFNEKKNHTLMTIVAKKNAKKNKISINVPYTQSCKTKQKKTKSRNVNGPKACHIFSRKNEAFFFSFKLPAFFL